MGDRPSQAELGTIRNTLESMRHNQKTDDIKISSEIHMLLKVPHGERSPTIHFR